VENLKLIHVLINIGSFNNLLIEFNNLVLIELISGLNSFINLPIELINNLHLKFLIHMLYFFIEVYYWKLMHTYINYRLVFQMNITLLYRTNEIIKFTQQPIYGTLYFYSHIFLIQIKSSPPPHLQGFTKS
jgi:hypothetical protein